MRSSLHPSAALAALLLACTLPLLIAYNLTPSSTLFNQLASLAGWGVCLWMLGASAQATADTGGGNPAMAALLLLLLAALAGPLWTGQPWSAALSSAALLAGALLVLLGGMRLGGGGGTRAQLGMDLFCLALLAAGLLSVGVSLVQVFAPGLADGDVIARSGIVGRAVGNMRQPNHLASLLMWSCVAAVWLANSARGRAYALTLPALLFALVFAVVLSASRTGMIGVGLLAIWGLLDRKLARLARWSLIATPLMLAISWWLMSVWASSGGDHAFGAESRLAEGAGSPSRLAILANAWALLKQYPLSGVGWGEFNLAWSMTPFPARPTAFFDHTHNLPMQLLVELGWPLGLLVLGLLTWALWQAFRAGHRAQGQDAVMLRCAFMIVLMIGLHSLLEYPLWYAYFLLPTAFALGLCLGGGAGRWTLPRQLWGLFKVGGALLIAGSLFAVWDYLSVVEIYAPSADAGSLEQRIERGQRSVFFAPQADYAAATSLTAGPAALQATRRTAHHLIDARLMMAWAKSLHASGDIDRARYVVQRLREFRSKTSDDWLAECEAVEPGDPLPFQCEAPSRDYSFREMR